MSLQAQRRRRQTSRRQGWMLVILVVVCAAQLSRTSWTAETTWKNVMISTTTDTEATAASTTTNDYSSNHPQHKEHSPATPLPAGAAPSTYRISDAPIYYRNRTVPHQSELGRPERTLVVLLGDIRGGNAAWKSLEEHVLHANAPADLALMVGKEYINPYNPPAQTRRESHYLYQRAKYIWEVDEYDDWGDAVDLINGTAWRTVMPQYLHPLSIVLGGVRMQRYVGSGAIVFMLRYFLAQHLQNNNHNGTTQIITHQYDRVVVTRTDHYYLCAHNLSQLDRRYLWLPTGEDYHGLTDRHVVVPSEYILDVLDILPHLLAHPDLYADILRLELANPERILQRRWELLGLSVNNTRIQRFDRPMFIGAVDGDPTRWRQKTAYSVPEGVHLKYPAEYNASHATCAGRSG